VDCVSASMNEYEVKELDFLKVVYDSETVLRVIYLFRVPGLQYIK
jgi:hypothetical protein